MNAAAPPGPNHPRPRAAQPTRQSADGIRNSVASNTNEDPVSNREYAASSTAREGEGLGPRRRRQQMRGVQGAGIAKDAFEVAERYASTATAVDSRTTEVDRRGAAGGAGDTARGGGVRAPRA